MRRRLQERFWYSTLQTSFKINGRTWGVKWIYFCNFPNLWEGYMLCEYGWLTFRFFPIVLLVLSKGARSHQLYLVYALMNLKKWLTSLKGRRHWRSFHWECSHHAFLIFRWCSFVCKYFRGCAKAYEGIVKNLYTY